MAVTNPFRLRGYAASPSGIVDPNQTMTQAQKRAATMSGQMPPPVRMLDAGQGAALPNVNRVSQDPTTGQSPYANWTGAGLMKGGPVTSAGGQAGGSLYNRTGSRVFSPLDVSGYGPVNLTGPQSNQVAAENKLVRDSLRRDMGGGGGLVAAGDSTPPPMTMQREAPIGPGGINAIGGTPRPPRDRPPTITMAEGPGGGPPGGGAPPPAAGGGPPPGVNPIDWVNEPVSGLFPGEPGYDEAMEEFQKRWEQAFGEPKEEGDGDQEPPGPEQDDDRIEDPQQPGGDGAGGGQLPPVQDPLDPQDPNIPPPQLPGGGPQIGDIGQPELPPGANPDNPPRDIEDPVYGPGGAPGNTPPQNPPGGAPGGAGGAGGSGGGSNFPPGFNPDPIEGAGGGLIPGGGGGLTNPGLIAALLEDYQRANREGREANESRYNDLINFLNQRYQRGIDNLAGAGEQALSDVDRDYERMAAGADQDLINRGLRNSTVRASVQRGHQDDRQANRRRVQEDVRKERLQTDAVLSGDVLSAMERRTDEYPDQNLITQLTLALGGAGYYPTAGGGGGQSTPQSPWIPRPGGGLVQNPGYTQLNSNPFALNRWSPTGVRYG